MTADERRALAAGAPPDMLLTLIRSRRLWHAANADKPVMVTADGLRWEMDGEWWVDDDLAAAVRHPQAPVFDEVFVAAMRRHLRRMSEG